MVQNEIFRYANQKSRFALGQTLAFFLANLENLWRLMDAHMDTKTIVAITVVILLMVLQSVLFVMQAVLAVKERNKISTTRLMASEGPMTADEEFKTMREENNVYYRLHDSIEVVTYIVLALDAVAVIIGIKQANESASGNIPSGNSTLVP